MRFKVLAVAAALAVSTAFAMAQEAPAIPLVLTPSGPGMSMVSFERMANGFFLDTFSFTPAAVSGNVSVDLAPASGSVNFFSALLNGQGFSFLPESGDTHFRFQSVVGTDQPLQLQVLGFGGAADSLSGSAAAYRGTVSVAAVSAVPEPETFALMFAGLFAVGAMARRTRRGSQV